MHKDIPGSDNFRYLLRPIQRSNAFAIIVLLSTYIVDNTLHIFLLKDTFSLCLFRYVKVQVPKIILCYNGGQCGGRTHDIRVISTI